MAHLDLSEQQQSLEAVARRTGTWVAVVSGLAFTVIAAVLIPWDWLPGGQIAAVQAGEVFSAAEIARAEEFRGQKWFLSWWELGISLLVAAALGLTPVGARLVRLLPGPWWVTVSLGTFLVMLIGQLVTLPLAWQSQRVDLEHGMSAQPWSGWLRDQALSLLVAWVSTALVLLMLLGLVRVAPRRWAVFAAGAAAAMAFLGSFVYPLLVEPLFNDFESMQAGPLRTQITEIADQEDVDIDDVLVADASRRTTTLNAYVSGIGSSRRVVVYDNLLQGLPRDQVLVVVAHELGHAKHHDVLLGTALGALGGAFGVGLLGVLLSSRRLRSRADVGSPGQPAVVPLLLLLMTVGLLLGSPVQNTLSRAVEARADRASLAATGGNRAFELMQRQLALRSLSDPTPPAWRQFWFGSHPTSLERIGLARAFER